jgi:hypothetical protein
MAVIVVCMVLVLAGLAAVVRWGSLAVEPPPASAPDAADSPVPPPVGLVVRRYLWYVTLAVTSGLVAGILAAGAGGRLVMRLLAVTAGPDAQGRITEAEQLVGRITVGGTLGFIVFTTLFFGLASGMVYLLLHRWLPGGWAGGLAYGALLLVVAATRLEPLRRGNPDFDLVGPGWVSVATFALLVVFHGMLVAALAGRLSQGRCRWWLPSLAPLPLTRPCCCCSRWRRWVCSLSSPARWWWSPAGSRGWSPPCRPAAWWWSGGPPWPWLAWWSYPGSCRPSSTSGPTLRARPRAMADSAHSKRRRRYRTARTVSGLTGHFYVRRRYEVITAYVLIQTEVG